MAKKHIVAVYGTLRQGHGNHRILAEGNAELKGAFRTNNNEWRMVSLGGFPACVPGDGNISVEVYEVDSPTLERLDCLEGYPTLYQKGGLMTPWGQATIYVMSSGAIRGAPHIESGDWNLFTGHGAIDVLVAHSEEMNYQTRRENLDALAGAAGSGL